MLFLQQQDKPGREHAHFGVINVMNAVGDTTQTFVEGHQQKDRKEAGCKQGKADKSQTRQDGPLGPVV
jgi:hypothetical protein